MKVKFKVTSFADRRATNSSLEIGNIYEGSYRTKNNSIWWKDPKNDEEWVFWVGDTCELVDNLEDILKDVYKQARESMEDVGFVTTEIDPQYKINHVK
jgi:hypothetical protein